MNAIRKLITGDLSDYERDQIELGATAFGVVILGFVLIVTTARFLALDGGL